jgi:hypothetical protein
MPNIDPAKRQDRDAMDGHVHLVSGCRSLMIWMNVFGRIC